MAERDDRVETALFRIATGFSITERRTIEEEDAHGNRKTKTETMRKRVPPDYRAAQAWLQARMPERWGEKDVEPDGIQLVHMVTRAQDEGNGGEGAEAQDGM